MCRRIVRAVNGPDAVECFPGRHANSCKVASRDEKSSRLAPGDQTAAVRPSCSMVRLTAGRFFMRS